MRIWKWQVVSEKASRIAELETLLREPSRVCSTSASDSCSSRCCGSDGGEESICQDSKENSNQRSSMSPGCAALSSPRRGDVKACGSGGVAHYIGERSMVPQSVRLGRAGALELLHMDAIQQ